MLKKYKPAIITFSVIALIAFGTVEYVKYLMNEPIESIPEHLQLKAPTEKILNSQTIKDQDNDDVVKYLYVSETEVPIKTIEISNQEIKEDISRRTKNAQFFKKSSKRGLHSPEGLWSQDASLQEGEKVDGLQNGSTAPAAAGDYGAVAVNEWIGRFYAGEPFYKDTSKNKWYQTETATTTAEEFSRQTKPSFLARVKAFLGMNVLADTISPFAGAGDGDILGFDIELTAQPAWDNARDPNEATLAVYDTVASKFFYVYMNLDMANNYTAYIYRAFFPIDTSGIDDGATITDAELHFFGATKYNTDDDGKDYIAVVQTTQASTDSLADTDFWECGANNNPTQGGSKDIGLMTANAYNSVALDATGKGWINKTGVTKLGLREGHDCENTIIGTNLVNGFSAIYFSEQTDTDKDPYLEVIYTAPSAAKTQINTPLTNKFTNGLVGNWSFNGQDMDWASSTAEALDRSGQGNNGNVIGAKAAIGKVGQGMEFDGAGDYIDCGDVYNGIKTVSFWIKADSITEKIIDLNGIADIEIISGTIIANNFSSDIYVDGVLASTIDTDWHYVTVATSTAVNASAVDIGRINAGYFNGLLDEVRIYNYALSADEILKHYRVWSRKMLIDPNKEYKTIIMP